MNDRILVDTNVLVYAYDRSSPQKQQQALQVLDRLVVTGGGAISTQVLAEFFVAVTRKIAAPLSIEQARDRIQNYVRSWPVLELTGLIVLEAARGVQEHRFNFWDAQVWATARLNQITVVFSEDFGDGVVVEGVRFVNPFTQDFVVERWGT